MSREDISYNIIYKSVDGFEEKIKLILNVPTYWLLRLQENNINHSITDSVDANFTLNLHLLSTYIISPANNIHGFF